MEKDISMATDEETFYKVISQRLEQISSTLDKLNNKFDQAQSEMHQINLKVQELEISRKYLNSDVESMKTQVALLKEFSSKMSVILGIGSFVISVAVTVITKIFIS